MEGPPVKSIKLKANLKLNLEKPINLKPVNLKPISIFKFESQNNLSHENIKLILLALAGAIISIIYIKN
jgi:hypothetical protein